MKKPAIIACIVIALFSCKVYTTIDFKEDGSGITDIRLDYSSYVSLMMSRMDTLDKGTYNRDALIEQDYSYEKLSGKDFYHIREILESIPGITHISTEEINQEGVNIHFEFADIAALKDGLIQLATEMDMMNSYNTEGIQKTMNSIVFKNNKMSFLSYSPVQAEIDRKNGVLPYQYGSDTLSWATSVFSTGNTDYEITLHFWKEVEQIIQQNATLSADKKTVYLTIHDIYHPALKDLLTIILKK